MAFVSIVSGSQTELTLPTECWWDHGNEMLNDEELSATSHEEEASKLLEQWQADQDDQDLLDIIMEVDGQICSNLLGDDHDLFDASCSSASPTGPLEELDYMNVQEEDHDDRFFSPLLNEDDETQQLTSTSSLSLEERYADTLKKLQESMKRTQETRKSLTMKTPNTETYLLSSILEVHQLQGYLKNLQQRTL
jgi:hypothetical protein